MKCTGRDCPMQYGTVDPSNCPADECPYVTKPLTNADKYFRNATDEELAERLSKQNFWNCPPHDKACPGYCRECWLDWLNQEVDE